MFSKTIFFTLLNFALCFYTPSISTPHRTLFKSTKQKLKKCGFLEGKAFTSCIRRLKAQYYARSAQKQLSRNLLAITRNFPPEDTNACENLAVEMLKSCTATALKTGDQGALTACVEIHNKSVEKCVSDNYKTSAYRNRRFLKEERRRLSNSACKAKAYGDYHACVKTDVRNDIPWLSPEDFVKSCQNAKDNALLRCAKDARLAVSSLRKVSSQDCNKSSKNRYKDCCEKAQKESVLLNQLASYQLCEEILDNDTTDCNNGRKPNRLISD